MRSLYCHNIGYLTYVVSLSKVLIFKQNTTTFRESLSLPKSIRPQTLNMLEPGKLQRYCLVDSDPLTIPFLHMNRLQDVGPFNVLYTTVVGEPKTTLEKYDVLLYDLFQLPLLSSTLLRFEFPVGPKCCW